MANEHGLLAYGFATCCLFDDWRKCSKYPPWASTQCVARLSSDCLPSCKIPGVVRIPPSFQPLTSLTSVVETVDLKDVHVHKNLRDLNQWQGLAVGPSRAICCSGNTLVKNCWITWRRCGGSGTCMSREWTDFCGFTCCDSCGRTLHSPLPVRGGGRKLGPSSLSHALPAVNLGWTLFV